MKMSKIKESSLELIGGTPILKLNRYTEKAGVKDATILIFVLPHQVFEILPVSTF